jgi:hypothetical protein
MSTIQDALADIVQHTHALGFVNLVKVTGEDSATSLSAVGDDRKVIVEATFKKPINDFIGTFGLPNLSKLNTILNIPEYKTDAKVTMSKQDKEGTKVPVGVHFENSAGDFKNDYRLMSAEVVNEQMKTIKFKGVNWDIDIVPSLSSIQRLKFQSQANNEITHFVAKTESGKLMFFFGDHSSHAGSFVFEQNITGELKKAWAWPVQAVISILSLPGDKTFKISDQGAAMITVDSGIADYNYILPAQTV